VHADNLNTTFSQTKRTTQDLTVKHNFYTVISLYNFLH